MKRFAIVIPAALCAASLFAQESLNKEIVIEREIKPELRAVSRINSFPTLILPEVKPATLTFSDMTTSTRIPGMISTLEPADAPDAITVWKQKGYASLGYFPAFNLGASAGYRFINKPHTSLGMWMQYNGNSYKGNNLTDCYIPLQQDAPESRKLERNDFTLGADFSKIFNRIGRLDLRAGFAYHSVNNPWLTDANPTYRAGEFDLDATWSARRHNIAYFINGQYNRFGFNNLEDRIADSGATSHLSQNIFGANGGASYSFTDESSFAALAGLDFVNYNHFNRLVVDDPDNPEKPLPTPRLLQGDGKTITLITITPSYRYYSSTFSATLGVKAQISVNSGKTIHFAPDVRVAWKPSTIFGMMLTAGGGEHINRIAQLYQINPYMARSEAYGLSHCPINSELTLKFGPFKGYSAEIFAGYEKANDWLMPTWLERTNQLVTFLPLNLSAWKYGVAFEGKINDKYSYHAKYTRTPGTLESASPLNPDRAKHVVNVGVTVRPIDKLTLDAGFTFRGTRAIYIYSVREPLFIAEGESPSIIKQPMRRISLGNSNSLNISANYEIFSWLSAFATFDNILGNRSYEVWAVERQGFRGLIGAAVKF